MQLPEDRRKKKNKKEERNEGRDEGSTSRPAINTESKSDEFQKKEKRTLRFQVPTVEGTSEESFVSAQSFTPTEEDITPTQTILRPDLRKFVLVPLRHSQPRKASFGRICRRNDDFSGYNLMSSSSRQLFEIVSHSPTLSDANINLLNATYQRRLEAVKEAILEGADINIHKDRQTPLLIAVEIGDERMVQYLLSVPKVDVDFRNSFGQTPLFVAVKNSFDRIVRLLLQNQADVDIADNLGRTPLLAAVFNKHLKLTKILLAYGADCDKPDLLGETPLDASAIKTPDMECLLTLLKVGASPDSVNLVGLPLLSRTILCFSDFIVLETLVQYGANVNYPDFLTKKTPLHFAALTNNLKVAKFLIAHGADVNFKSTNGFIPLEEASVHCNTEVADYLALKLSKTKKYLTSLSKKGPGPTTHNFFEAKGLKK